MNGFFSTEALEALQEAYSLQLTPEEMDIDEVTGLPTNQVSNTSPWHGQVEMWKYPDGVRPQPQNEIHYTHDDSDDEEEIEEYDGDGVDPSELEEEIYYEIEEGDAEMSEAEVEALIEDLLQEG